MNVLLDNTDIFLRGFGNTLVLFLFSAIGSLILGTFLAMLRVSPVPVLRIAGTTYVTIVRNTPLTLVFFFFVFAFPLLKIISQDDYTATVGAIVALTLYTSAFVCEALRSGVNAVPRLATTFVTSCWTSAIRSR